MQDSIFVNYGSMSGTIEAYPSKSYIQRALILGIMNRNEIEILNYADSDDSRAVLKAIEVLGAEVKFSGISVTVKGPQKFINSEISCNESGLCLRLFTPVLSLSSEQFVIRGSGSLFKRGNEHISETLGKLGVQCRLEKDILSVLGPLKNGKIIIENPGGSQLISGLLFALSKVHGDSEIIIKDPVSFPYIKMTAELLNRFGAEIKFEGEERIFIRGAREFSAGRISIEGDWSSAAFFLVAGAIAGDVTVIGLDAKSQQADREILRYLKKAGAGVEAEESLIRVTKSELKGFTADIKDHPDLFIPLVVLGLNCTGETRIYNYERLKYKESDRPSVLVTELKRAGAEIEFINDYISIKKSRLVFSELDPHNDHRLAMGFAIAALNSADGFKIKDFHCVSKSFPLFFETLISLTENSK